MDFHVSIALSTYPEIYIFIILCVIVGKQVRKEKKNKKHYSESCQCKDHCPYKD